MADDDDAGDRPHEATPEKLRKAREKGEAPQSKDLLTTAAFAVIVAGMVFWGVDLVRHVGGGLRVFLADPMAFSAAPTAMAALFQALWLPVVLLLLVPVAGALLAAATQRNLFFAAARIKPRWSRLSPLANAKQKFGPPGWVEFAKTLFKVLVFCAALAYALYGELERLAGLPRFSAQTVFGEGGRLAGLVLQIGLAVAVPIALADLFWQRYEHLRKQRMSHKELRDEVKDAEGNPEVKGRRRQRAVSLATQTMLRDVAEADVVVINPTHYAVALHWDGSEQSAPRCVAKGADMLAIAIRDRAQDNGVPVRQDAPLARAIFATVEVGEMIRVEHYAAVAAALRFAQLVRRDGA